MLRHLRGHVIVLWDNARIHRGEEVKKLRAIPRLIRGFIRHSELLL
jgi:hypothetical protein